MNKELKERIKKLANSEYSMYNLGVHDSLAVIEIWEKEHKKGATYIVCKPWFASGDTYRIYNVAKHGKSLQRHIDNKEYLYLGPYYEVAMWHQKEGNKMKERLKAV